MKKGCKILLAGGFGAVAVLGFFSIREIIRRKRFKNNYQSFKALQEIQSADEGIEYYGLK